MTANDFAALCNQFTVAPEVALEFVAVREALAKAKNTGSDELVRSAMENSF